MRRIVIGATLLVVGSVQAQKGTSVDNRPSHSCESIVRGQELNPYAYIFRNHCYQSDARYQQTVAKIYGRPQPSLDVARVPAHGTAEAKKWGVACMGGLVMLRIKNGWSQALDKDRRYYRCIEK